MPAYQVAVIGRVQGVNYRAHAQAAAQALGVHGWVRNLPDGSVQAHIQHADEAVLGELIDRLGAGPPGAAVESVVPDSVPEEEGLGGFDILR